MKLEIKKNIEKKVLGEVRNIEKKVQGEVEKFRCWVKSGYNPLDRTLVDFFIFYISNDSSQ